MVDYQKLFEALYCYSLKPGHSKDFFMWVVSFQPLNLKLLRRFILKPVPP